MNAFDKLIEKSDGDLIKAQEWNDLVNGVIRMGAELQAVIATASAIEAYVGLKAGYAGENLTQRIESLEAYVGLADDAPGADTLSARVASLEQADNVTQTEFNELESAIEPLLEQYVVKFQSDDIDYLLGDTATITATVRTLKDEIPRALPWIDFIATWGRLKAAPGFEVREGTGLRSMAVRTNAQGIARVQVTAEQNKRLSVEEEAEISGFFGMELAGEPILFKQAIKNAPTTQSEYMDKCYAAVSREYESSRQAIRKLADDYYADKIVGSRWEEFWPENRWKKYRSTVIGFARNDADPTTPDQSRGVSSIQLLFQDWIGPWVNGYVEDDAGEVLIWEGHFVNWAEKDPDDFLGRVEAEMDESIFHRGPVGREKGLKALGKAAEKMVAENIKDPGGWVKDVIRNAADAQRVTHVLQDARGPQDTGAAGGAAMKVIFAQGKQVNAVGKRADQAKNEVLASTEFGNLQAAVGTLQDSTTNVGRNLMGALQDIEHKVVNINAFDSAALQTSVNEIKAKIGVVRNLVPDR
jgi:hypothetical protein